MSWIAVGIGAAVGAAGGAAIGSKKGGDDVWKGALIGGALGAAGGAPFGGTGAAAGGAGAGALEGGGTALAGGTGEAGITGLLGTGGSAVPGVGGTSAAGFGGQGLLGASGSAVPGIGGAGTGGLSLGGAGGGGMGLGSAGGFGGGATLGGSGEAFGSFGGASLGGTGGGTGGMGAGGGSLGVPADLYETVSAANAIGAPSATTGGAGIGGGAGGGAGAGGGGAGGGGGGAGGLSGWWKGLGPLEQAGVIGAGTLGIGALLKSDQNQYGVPSTEEEDPYSYYTFDRRTYKPSKVTPNVYKPKQYADGGIAALADGGGPMGNAMYPQAQQEHTNFASSTQYPNSMRSAMAADYDTRTSPQTGQELPLGMAAGGHLGGYSDGGQMLRGPGDGVSDSIPASIGGKQPARLADGEFVIPARAVSELGNGSTNAGAKQLYNMLDRIENKRKKGKGLAYQAKPHKLMPI